MALLPDGTERRGHGTLEGTIAHERSGSEGFGYDPLFVPAGETRTVAELGRRMEGAELPQSARGARVL